MAKEVPQPQDEFGFSEREKLYNRVSEGRFQELLEGSEITVQRVEESSNSYGEFLFVTVSKQTPTRLIWVSFYGLGYHEYRERYIAGEWFWFQTDPLPQDRQQPLTKEEAHDLISKRREGLAPYLTQESQSGRGRLFEMLADLTDEDGALAELEDLDELADWLSGDLD